MIDLRSDTITRPSTDMRAAMASAEVGDDVYGDDPTVNRLEERVAALLGKDAAMYVASGTMANQIAIRTQTQPGDSVVLEQSAHIGSHEMGAAAHTSGVTLKRLTGDRGRFTAEQLRTEVPVRHASMPPHLYEPYTLVAVENSHNEAGGTVWGLDAIREVTATARDLGMAAHLDGARLWNASATTGISEAAYADTFDTVAVCFSKGLGAPVGSALVGSSDLIAEARRFKHMFGGGFRQAGLIAAGALYALEHNRGRLGVDHAHALSFAEAVANSPHASLDLESVQTNIVYFTTPKAAEVVDASAANGVAMLKLGPDLVRAVFHLDVSPEDTALAIDTVTSALAR